MPAPFYLAIKGTTAGTPGTGAFTPNAAAAGSRAWSTLAAGWIGLVRFEDGTAWEIAYAYWNGTTLSRGANQFLHSSTDALLSLTSAATAAMVIDGGDVQTHVGVFALRSQTPQNAAGAFTAQGLATATLTGTAAGTTISGGNGQLGSSPRISLAGAVTANAQSAVSNGSNPIVLANSSLGGFEFCTLFGFSTNTVYASMRVLIGLVGSLFTGNTGEPSAFATNMAALIKDSTDTNYQFATNSAVGGATKIDTGIAPTLNDWLEFSTWQEPGSAVVHFLLINRTTGAIVYKNTSTDVPAAASTLVYNVLAGLSSAQASGVFLNVGPISIRAGG